MSRVEARVNQIIADQLGLGEEEISLESSLSTDLGADSLDLVELLLAFEEEFEIEITDDEAAKFKTVGDVVDLLSNRVQ